jgi:hypothetical protein
MGKEILSATMTVHLGSEPALHPVNFGIEFIVRRLNDPVHLVQVDKGKDCENVPPIQGVSGEGANLIEVCAEIPMSKSDGAEPVCPPLPGDEMLDRQFLRLTFAKHDNSAHVYTQRL